MVYFSIFLTFLKISFLRNVFSHFFIAKYFKKTLLLKMILRNKATNNNNNNNNKYLIYTAKMDQYKKNSWYKPMCSNKTSKD